MAGGENNSTIGTLKSMGLLLSIDDFGTGYSSLSYLRSFPFDKIKIDRCFITDITETDGASVIVQAVANIAADHANESVLILVNEVDRKSVV